MGSLTFLPGVQNYPGFSLQRSSRFRGNSVYSRYLEKRIGMIRDDAYCEEWRIPPIGGANFTPRALASSEDTLYVSSTSSMVAVFEKVLKTGKFLHDPTHTLSLTSYDIAVDDGGGIWTKCVHHGDPNDTSDSRNGLARITREGANEYAADYYLLPDEFRSPFGLWPVGQGREIWFSILNSNTYGTGYMVGRLSTEQRGVTGFNFDYFGRPSCIDVLGTDGGSTVWVTESDPFLSTPRYNVFEFQPERLQANVYADEAVEIPRELAEDSEGHIWFTSWDGHVNLVSGRAVDRVNVSERSHDTIHGRIKLEAVTEYPELYSDFRVSPIDQVVQPTQQGPFRRWRVGGGARPSTPDITSDRIVYFADPNMDAIGRLKP